MSSSAIIFHLPYFSRNKAILSYVIHENWGMAVEASCPTSLDPDFRGGHGSREGVPPPLQNKSMTSIPIFCTAM